MLLRLTLTIAFLTLSCSRGEIKSPAPNPIATIASPIQKVEPTATPVTNHPIRSIDFCNVAFPHYPVYVTDHGKKKYVTLKPGDGCPAQLSYGDVTGDGAEEAMMMLVAWIFLLEVEGVLPAASVYLTKLVVDGLVKALRNGGSSLYRISPRLPLAGKYRLEQWQSLNALNQVLNRQLRGLVER